MQAHTEKLVYFAGNFLSRQASAIRLLKEKLCKRRSAMKLIMSMDARSACCEICDSEFKKCGYSLECDVDMYELDSVVFPMTTILFAIQEIQESIQKLTGETEPVIEQDRNLHGYPVAERPKGVYPGCWFTFLDYALTHEIRVDDSFIRHTQNEARKVNWHLSAALGAMKSRGWRTFSAELVKGHNS